MKKAAKPVLERLMLRQFGGRTRTGRVGLLHRAEHVMKCGLVDEPLWLSAVRESPPPGLPPPKGRPPKIVYPEDALMAEFYKRDPSARFTPMDLNHGLPPFPQRFAWRQLALMQAEGLSKEAARVRVEAEVEQAAARQAVRVKAGKPGEEWLTPPAPMKANVIQNIQAEEEVVVARTRQARTPTSELDGA